MKKNILVWDEAQKKLVPAAVDMSAEEEAEWERKRAEEEALAAQKTDTQRIEELEEALEALLGGVTE